MILVTGAAGFIGFHMSKRLLDEGHQVLGIDNLNEYYDASLKRDRLAILEAQAGFEFREMDFGDNKALSDLCTEASCPKIIHLGAQAGVRYSLESPHVYAHSNLVGFLNILEVARHHKVEHLIYASSSSVYGANIKQPFSETDPVDHQISLYAATKRSNELMAHAYSHLFQIPTTGLRFFTVYGPWGRPDMAFFIFAKAILSGVSIKVFNNGDMKRDFTYVGDVVEGIMRVLDLPPPASSKGHSSPSESPARFQLFNIGSHHPVSVMVMIRLLETALGKKAKLEFLPMQPGDVQETYADMSRFRELTGFSPTTSLEEGIELFVEWYVEYYGKN
ncbi:MAG: NAD-dependent epimerase [Planctomycetota bacterium]|nr:NAD-dependent epimerase [Planctomycetota bacterium]MDA1141097.1 NAD-dependent epimerase [Planctomycetota bacterium]